MKKILLLTTASLLLFSCKEEWEESPSAWWREGLENSGKTEEPDPADPTNEVLPDWQEGYLDIHSINSARGECTFYIYPDGTTLVSDVGDISPNYNAASYTEGEQPMDPKPNASVRAYVVYANYIRHFMAATGSSMLDYVELTHYHIDHVGAVVASYEKAPAGYYLTGAAGLYQEVKFAKLIDRDYPNYNHYTWEASSCVDNLKLFVDFAKLYGGMKMEKFDVGSTTQMAMVKNPSKYPEFKVTNIVGNGVVWNGTKTTTYTPGSENATSCGFLITYGKFDWFAAGDLVSTPAPKAAEAVAALANGGVDATKANHHMSNNAMTSNYMKPLQPKTIVNQSFYKKQPDAEVLGRILSDTDYMGQKNIFLTNFHKEAIAEHPELAEKVTAYGGHIVIRVAPGGESYTVYLLDDTDMKYRVKGVYGPYKSI